MKHFYKITDPFEIRVTVLYTLSKAQRALTAYEISHIILGSAQIEFFDIHDALSFLTEAKEIFPFRSMEDKTLYSLTESGTAAAKSFAPQVPLEVQEYIDDCIAALFDEQKKRNALVAQSIPVSFDDFAAHLELKDDTLSLLSMTVYAKDEDLAKKMCKNFRNNTAKIYDTLISLLTSDTADDA